MASEYGELVGIDQLHYATIADSSTAYTPGENTYLAPAGDISTEGKSSIKIRYYDNKPYFVSTTEGETTATTTVSGVPLSLAAILTGKPYDTSKGVFIDTGDLSSAPWCAFSGRMDLGDGGHRYFQYLKGKFSYSKMEATSKKDDIDEKTTELTYTAVLTDYQFTMPDSTTHGVKGVFADTTDAAFVTGESWFSQVQTPATIGAPGALSMSSIVPAADATNVVATANIVLTFSNRIADSNIFLVNSPTGSLVTVAKSWDSTGKILTMTHSALTAGARHAVVITNVTDIFGQELADAISYFTVAS